MIYATILLFALSLFCARRAANYRGKWALSRFERERMEFLNAVSFTAAVVAWVSLAVVVIDFIKGYF